jgi:hypothetical protein
MSNLISEVTLKGTKGPLTVRLSAPPSLALRNEVTYAIIESEPRACGAALGLCSPTQIQKEVPYRGQSVLVYGQAVMDFLLAEGVSWFAALNAGSSRMAALLGGVDPGE